MEATITKNGLVYSVDMKTIYYADDSGEFKGTIPNGVERIEDEAFSCCAVEKIYIPDSVTSVGSNLFENATSLKSVRLPSGLKKLSPYMFAGCSSLEQIEMPFEIESFEEGLFAGCSSLKEIPFRAGIKELPNYVFSGCSQLRSLILPNTIEKICEGAVSDCENLTTLVLPASLKEIEEGAFEGCFNLCHIRLNGENGYFRVDDAESSLYKKNPDGTETLILHLEGNTLSEVPTFHEVDESAPVSILDFNEEDDIADDDSDIILTQEELDKVCPRTEDSSEDIMQKHESVISNPIENFATEESNADVADRLAEIMGQSSVSTSDEISADEIPYATAEELEAGRLAPSAQVAEESENAEYEEEISQDEVAECEESAEVPQAEDDMSSRLAEIMGQSSVSTSDEISADEIPYATAEELEAGCLAPSTQAVEETEDAEYEEEIPQDEVAECEETAEVPQAEDGESTEITEESEYSENTETGGKLLEAEITENMDEFENTEMIENMEIAENPEVSQDITEEVSSVSDEVVLETEEVSSCEETASEEVISDTAEYEEVFFEMDEGEYSSCIEDYFFGIGRYETIAMETSCDEEKTLYVFAKSLNAEHNFSSKLISCCRRLANVHNYSQVKLLSNPQFIEENREKFSDFMKEKDVIYACSVDSLSLMTEDEKDLCGLLGIALDRDGLIAQAKTASDKNAPFIKLLIQDNID